MSKDLNITALAREVAMDILPLEVICTNAEITLAEFNELAHNPEFQRLLNSYKLEWESAMNTAERVKVKSAAIVESSLLGVYEDLCDPKTTIGQKVDALKQLGAFAEIGKEKAQTQIAGERFQININIGAGRKPVTIEGTAVEQQAIPVPVV